MKYLHQLKFSCEEPVKHVLLCLVEDSGNGIFVSKLGFEKSKWFDKIHPLVVKIYNLII